MSDYTTLSALRDLVLEESWILAVAAHPGRLVFTADFVMTVDHPDYAPALPSEVFSYLRGELTFSGVTDLEWTGQGDPPAIDAAGTVDWGHIDTMTYADHLFELYGDWGHIRVTARDVSVTYTSEAGQQSR